MPKLSRFNHFQRWQEGYYLAFNAVSGALAMMTSENYATYQQLEKKLSNGSQGNLDTQEEELLVQLKYGNFVVDSDLPELDWLKFRYRKLRYDPTSLGLIIAPTMACNMACDYCFEENKKGRMSPRVVEALIAFVEKQAGVLNDVQTSWYGGEPLLAFDIIEDLTESMLDLASEYKFTYACSGVISNGYLLDEKTADHLADMKVGQVQVTIDGPARTHNQKRPLKNGRGSFNTIIRNIQYASTKLPVVIRVNLDKSFTSEIIEELLGELREAELHNKVGVYFGQLEPATATCSNISDSCYESKAYSQKEITYYRLLQDHGFLAVKLPQPITTFCFAQLANSFLIDPDGDMYRCFNYAGDKSRSMGNIQQEASYQHPEFNHLFSFDPFENESCRNCEIMPLCMGGCPSRRADRDVPEDEICDSWKYNLEPMLELVAMSRQQEARQKADQATQES
jgi:uncharacterized protein